MNKKDKELVEVQRMGVKFIRFLTEENQYYYKIVEDIINYINNEVQENNITCNDSILYLIDMLEHLQFNMTDSYIRR